MKDAVPKSIALVTLLLCPTWLSHLFADDGGLITLGGGMLTEADIFGAPGSISTKKIPPMFAAARSTRAARSSTVRPPDRAPRQIPRAPRRANRSAARSSVAADPRDPRRAKLERLGLAPRAADDPRARRHPIVFHLCAVCGLFAFALCFIAIAATYYGDAKVKKVVCAIYGAWLLCIFAVQYTHPWTGSAPESIFQMPAPTVYMMVLVVGTGVALDDDVKLKLK